MSPNEIVAIKERWAPSLRFPPEYSNQPSQDIWALLDEVERLQAESVIIASECLGRGQENVELSVQLAERDQRIAELEKLADDLGRLAGAGGPTHDAVKLLTEHGLIR